MKHRVVITGMGAVTPLGNSVQTFEEGLYEGRSGVGPVTLFDTGTLATNFAAEVRQGSWEAPLNDRKIGFALEAADQAMGHASLGRTKPGGAEGGAGAAVAMGLGLELFSMEDMTELRRPGFTSSNDPGDRLGFLQTPADICLHLISKAHGLKAPPMAHVSACAAGADAIGHAFRLVASGRRRWMLAGGTDSMINPLGLGGFSRLGALSTQSQDPEKASRPFDRRRDGFILGEGAAVVVLETLEGARARGARVMAEVVGFGNSFDAHGISEPHPEGRGAVAAMRAALEEGGLSPEDVDWVNAHGTSTPKNDGVETLALKTLLGDRAYEVPVNSTKSMIGHLISAAGAVEAVAAVLGLVRQRLHPTINLEEPDPDCDLDYVAEGARDFPHDVVLSNSFGFGGQNAALVFRRHLE